MFINYIRTRIDRLLERDFLLNLFTFVVNSDTVEYTPPMNIEYLKKNYPNLIDDPVHKWRAETGIELIHEESTIDEFIRIQHNWLAMPFDRQIISDKKCMELFGKTNYELSIDLLPKIVEKNKGNIEDGRIFLHSELMNIGNAEYYYYENGKLINIPKPVNNTGAPFSLYDYITIKKNDIANHTQDIEIKTTIGRYITNYILIANIIGNKIKYVNDEWNISKIESLYAQLLLDEKIETNDYREYINHGYFLGHFAELCVPTLSAKALTTSPEVHKRKKELLEQYKDQLSDPKVVESIEKELIELDKQWIKGDSSEGFYGVLKKSYNVHRKKMHIMVGGVEDFNTEGGTVTITHSLGEGITAENFAAVANEIRKGHYDRGKETAKGGEMTKFIFRAFQDIKIIEDDCGTKSGIPIVFGDVLNPKDFLNRTIIVGPDKNEVLITEKNMNSYIGKKVLLRSPMSCKSKNGLCYKCSGLNFKKLNIANPGVRAIEISSKFMYASMLSMHGTSIQTNKINPKDFFLIR